jgi:hypothetical protein
MACIGWAGPCWTRRPFVQNAIGSFATWPLVLAILLWRWPTRGAKCQRAAIAPCHYFPCHYFLTPMFESRSGRYMMASVHNV